MRSEATLTDAQPDHNHPWFWRHWAEAALVLVLGLSVGVACVMNQHTLNAAGDDCSGNGISAIAAAARQYRDDHQSSTADATRLLRQLDQPPAESVDGDAAQDKPRPSRLLILPVPAGGILAWELPANHGQRTWAHIASDLSAAPATADQADDFLRRLQDAHCPPQSTEGRP